MLEIDIDIWRLITRGTNEALEQQLHAVGIDRRDVEAITHRRIGRRTTALTENTARARETDDIVNGKKVRRVAERTDQRQFMGDLRPHLGRHAVRPTRRSAKPGEMHQFLLRRVSVGHRLGRIFITQFVQIEAASVGNLHAACNGVRMARKQTRHLGTAFQMALGIGVQAPARIVDVAMRADAGEHIL